MVQPTGNCPIGLDGQRAIHFPQISWLELSKSAAKTQWNSANLNIKNLGLSGVNYCPHKGINFNPEVNQRKIYRNQY